MDPMPTDEAGRDRELRRVSERLEVVSNWLIQGRCGDDAECAEARRLEIAALRRRRDALLAGRG